MERNVLRQGKEMLLPNSKPRWSPVVVLLMVNAGLWGSSCVYANDFDPWTLKGREPAECQGVGDDAPCAILAGPCRIGKCNAAGLCEFTAVEMPMVPASANPCIRDICVDNQLAKEHLPNGSLCSVSNAGMGQKSFCVEGTCIIGECFEDGDCTGDAYCHAYQCATCKDALENGDETGVDCGGEHCKKCPGEACTNSTSCVTGHCTDGVCCDEACDGTCKACSAKGHCEAIPFGQPDDQCDPGQLCNAMEECKQGLGQDCLDAKDCVEGFCYSGVGPDFCALPVGDPCTVQDKQQCFTWYCDPITLTCELAPNGSPCIHENQCVSQKCYTNTCQ